MPEWRDLLLVEGGAGSDRTMASALQHGAAAFVARLQATGATSYLAEGNGAWRYGKRCAFPTSPHPRLRLRTRLEKGATLTFHLVQKIGQVTEAFNGIGMNIADNIDLLTVPDATMPVAVDVVTEIVINSIVICEHQALRQNVLFDDSH